MDTGRSGIPQPPCPNIRPAPSPSPRTLRSTWTPVLPSLPTTLRQSCTQSKQLPARSHTRWYEPPDTYESKHRWDPRATWTPEEERKLTRRLDLRVALVACVCFAALQLDRGNIHNALADNLLGDIHVTTGDYNIGMTIFYVCFLCAELPSQMSESMTCPP